MFKQTANDMLCNGRVVKPLETSVQIADKVWQGSNRFVELVNLSRPGPWGFYSAPIITTNHVASWMKLIVVKNQIRQDNVRYRDIDGARTCFVDFGVMQWHSQDIRGSQSRRRPHVNAPSCSTNETIHVTESQVMGNVKTHLKCKARSKMR